MGNGMGKQLDKLTALAVTRQKIHGLYSDGGGLYLQVTSATAKSWIFRYKQNGRTRDMGLGSITALPLAAARREAAACRLQRQSGLDPIAERKAARTRAALDSARSITLGEAAERFIEAMQDKWRNAKHAKQWRTTFTKYAATIAGLPVASIDTALVLKVVEPLWKTRTETANRVRGRIEQVLDWAKVRGMRTGDNPARWRGHLDMALPKRSQVRKRKHHAAMPYSELPAFMARLRAIDSITARALEWTILTAARTTETTGAQWPELDMAENVWTVPAERIKAKRLHRVPLSRRAVAIVRELSAARLGKHVFPGRKAGRGLSNAAMMALLERMLSSQFTVHGFRSTFRDWAAEQTNYPRELAEVALSHRVGDDTERAYQRGDLLEKRRKLMAAWENYCATPAGERGKILPMRATR